MVERNGLLKAAIGIEPMNKGFAVHAGASLYDLETSRESSKGSRLEVIASYHQNT
jgi:hypothetical protein